MERLEERTLTLSQSQRRTISRRRFLAWISGGIAALMLGACHRRKPTPTPTRAVTSRPTRIPARPSPVPVGPHQAYLPNVMTEDGSSPLPLEPDPDTTRAATPTPEATAPPTENVIQPVTGPEPTPFPAGPASKLGVVVAYKHPQLFDLLSTGNVAVVKTLELNPTFMAEIKAASPSTLIVARLTPLEDVDWAKVDPRQLARDFVNRLMPIAGHPGRRAHVDAWEAYNEPVVETPDAMARLAEFEAERTRLLAREGIRSCVGNFSTGHPKLELWPHFFPALEAVKAHNGYLGLHEYSAPYMWFGTGPFQLRAGDNEGDEGWLTLRYRKAYRYYLQPAGLDVPLLITETGIDGGIRERPGPPGLGWKDFADFWQKEGRVTTTPEGFYVEQLAWYDAHLMQDAYVKGAAIYALVVFGDWTSFEIVGPCAKILQQYLAVHPPRG